MSLFYIDRGTRRRTMRGVSMDMDTGSTKPTDERANIVLPFSAGIHHHGGYRHKPLHKGSPGGNPIGSGIGGNHDERAGP